MSKLIIVCLLLVILFLTLVKESFNDTIYFKDNVDLKNTATVNNLNVLNTLTTKEFQIGCIRVNEDQLDALRDLPQVFKTKICLDGDNSCLDKDTIEFMKKLKAQVDSANDVFMKVNI